MQTAGPLLMQTACWSHHSDDVQARADLLAKVIDGLADVLSAATTTSEPAKSQQTAGKAPTQIQMTDMSREKTPVFEGRQMLKSAVDDPAATELATWNPDGLPPPE